MDQMFVLFCKFMLKSKSHFAKKKKEEGWINIQFEEDWEGHPRWLWHCGGTRDTSPCPHCRPEDSRAPVHRSCGMTARGAAQDTIPVSTGAAKLRESLSWMGNSLAWPSNSLHLPCAGCGSDLPYGESCQIWHQEGGKAGTREPHKGLSGLH